MIQNTTRCRLAANMFVSNQKWYISPEFKAGGRFEPEEYMEYFEDSNLAANEEIRRTMPFPVGYR
jgi:hypothetical protein